MISNCPTPYSGSKVSIPSSGVDQGRHTKIGERRNSPHRIQRERGRPADILAEERELVLVGDVQVETGFRLQIRQCGG